MAKKTPKASRSKEFMRQAWREGKLVVNLPDVRDALARIDAAPREFHADLGAYRERILSQHGEDGITYELLRRTGMERRTCVEISGGHNGGNAGFLVAGLDYRGVFLDEDEDLAGIAGALFSEFDVDVVSARIDPTTVDQLVADHGVAGDIDHLGIDLDGVDYWIWEGLTSISPRLVVVTYNPMFGQELAVTIPSINGFDRKERVESGRLRWPKGYYGASLRAFERLARSRGYRLVGSAPGGRNAYFLRDDVAGDTPAISVEEAYRVPEKSTHLRHLQAIEREGVIGYLEGKDAPLVEVDEPAESIVGGSASPETRRVPSLEGASNEQRPVRRGRRRYGGLMTSAHRLTEGARRGGVRAARATHLERPARERVLPLVRSARTKAFGADTSDDQVLRAVEAELRHAADTGEQVLVGPWLSELGFEVLYWVPFLRWAQEAFDLDPVRLTAVSRGGVSSWYTGVCDQYLEIFDAYSPDEFRQLTLARWEWAGGQKQTEVSPYDHQVLRKLTEQRSRGVRRSLHPWLMYRLFRLYWREAAPAARILDHTHFRPFARPEYPEVEQRLPTEDFVAAKFYFRPSFPATPENRRMVAELLRGVAGERPVVLLNTGLDLDDHDEWRADGQHTMTTVLDGVPPSRNLEAQSVAISRSSLFIGTYGGLSYLAPAYGVPSVAFYSEPAHFLRPHLDMARRAASATGSAIISVDARDPSALAGLDPEATLKASAG